MSSLMDYALTTGLSAVIVALCIAIHYEALNLINSLTRRFRTHRTGLMVAMMGLFAAHVVEIWVYAGGYLIAVEWLSGSISVTDPSWFEFVYYSAMVYTTVGFGDIIPEGALRMMTMSEALSGLSLITWSASFTFLEMQRLWRD